MEKRSCFDGYAGNDHQMMRYHDEEWGKPCHDEQNLIELFFLEMFQAGLSWKTILHKREAFRNALCGFDVDKVAAFDEAKVEELMQDPTIIRNRKKIEGAIINARLIKDIQGEFGSLSNYLWNFTGDQSIFEPIEVTRDELSDEVSKDMKKRGMKYVGSVTIFSYLQSVGIIYSHPRSCWRFDEDGAEEFVRNRYSDGRVYQVED